MLVNIAFHWLSTTTSIVTPSDLIETTVAKSLRQDKDDEDKKEDTPPVTLLKTSASKYRATQTVPLSNDHHSTGSDQHCNQYNQYLLDKICAETICPYPPGIPVVIAGEILTERVLKLLMQLRKAIKEQEQAPNNIEYVDNGRIDALGNISAPSPQQLGSGRVVTGCADTTLSTIKVILEWILQLLKLFWHSNWLESCRVFFQGM